MLSVFSNIVNYLDLFRYHMTLLLRVLGFYVEI